MRVLIVVISRTLQEQRWWHNLRDLPGSLIANLTPEDTVHIIACTSATEDLPPGVNWSCGSKSFSFHGKQFNKMSHALSIWSQHYDWYIKIRPEIVIREPINLRNLSPGTISARAREYWGPQKIKYGASLGGSPPFMHVVPYAFQVRKNLDRLQLDDQIYIFDDEVRRAGAFEHEETSHVENETYHTDLWNKRKIKLEVIGINCELECYNTVSGDLQGI